MRAPRSPAQPQTTRLPNKARRLPQTKTPQSLVWAIPAAPELNEANMQSLTEATHAGNPVLLASKPLRRALRLQAKSPAAPGARTLRCRQTKPSPRRLFLTILSSNRQESRACGLTVKLRGRAQAPDSRRGRTLSPGARGAKQTTRHGPLERLLEDAFIEAAVRARTPEPKPKSTARPVSRRPQAQGTAATKSQPHAPGSHRSTETARAHTRCLRTKGAFRFFARFRISFGTLSSRSSVPSNLRSARGL